VTLVVAGLVALAAWLAVGAPPEPRLARMLDRSGGPSGRDRSRSPSGPPRGATVAAGGVAGLALLLLVGGLAGAVLAMACVVGIPMATRTMESRDARQRREDLERQAPLLADLLAATLASGAPMRPALAAVGAAIGEPSLGALRPVLAAIDLGADPAVAWRTADGPLATVAAAVVRSTESGAPLSTVLARISDDMRRERQAAVEVAARAAGVRAVAPLAACFLPAFLLVGVVPVVASLAGALIRG
jgi:Flp pilus assembly protein TadB